MAYIGKSPVIGNFVKLDAITAVNGQAAYTMQNGGSNFTDYESVNQFLVSLNGTIQAPTDSFTVSGSTLTFASNLSTGDVIDFIMVFGNSLSAGTPTDATVSTAKIVNDAVTAAKIAGNAVGSSEIAANAVGSSEIANNAITSLQLAASALGGKTMTGAVTFSGTATLGNQTSDTAVIGGSLGIQDTAPVQKLHIDEVAGMDVGTGTSGATTVFTLDSFSASTFRTAKYNVQVTNSTDTNFHAIEIFLFHDGSTVYLTQYASIYDNGVQATFDADISGGNVRLRVTPASGDTMAYKFIRTTIEV